MKAAPPPDAAGNSSMPDSPGAERSSTSTVDTNFRDEENGLGHQLSIRPPSGNSTAAGSLDLATGYIKRKTSQLMDAVSLHSHKSDTPPLAQQLATLVEAYANSDIAAEIKNEIEEVRASARAGVDGNGTEGGETRDIVVESSLLRGRKRASWGTQFRILSGRAFKNLYRDPALLVAHYISSIALARTFYSHPRPGQDGVEADHFRQFSVGCSTIMFLIRSVASRIALVSIPGLFPVRVFLLTSWIQGFSSSSSHCLDSLP